MNNCQFKDTTDVFVSFDGEEEIKIHPEYVRTIKRYEYKELASVKRPLQSRISISPICNVPIMPWNRPTKIDKRWCELNIKIKNIGKTVVKTPKLVVSFRPEDIVEIDDNFYYCNAFGINEAARAQINAGRDARREVFQTYMNQLEYIPKNSVFVQKDYRDFQISIIPADGITRIPLVWQFLCEDYQKEGYLIINVDPIIEEHIETIEVHDKSKMKPDEVTIEAKIIEK